MSSNYHRKPYFRSNAGPSSQKNAITPGLCGLFFTAENEQRAVPEAKNLIDRFLEEETLNLTADKSESSETTEKSEDISDSLKTACHQYKRGHKSALRQLETKARNTLFFISPQITPENVYSLAEKMVKLCLEDEAQTRFLAKVIPIEETCYASMPQILSSLSGMLSKHLESFTKDFDFPPCYAIDFKARNTQAIERQPVYDEVVALMNEQSKGSKVNLTMPDLLIVVHAIRTVAFLSIIRNYAQNKKYVLRKPPPAEENKEKKEKVEDEKEDDGDDNKVGGENEDKSDDGDEVKNEKEEEGAVVD
uniref:THUMP domain-containing protein n=1 Tax=Meloidogyne javanica TaxID=6303 RepID=A0A915LLM5_MELJA